MTAHDINPFVEAGRRSPVGVALERWLDGSRWRRVAETALSGVGLTFKRWLALAAIDALARRADGAASQIEIARRTGLDEMSVSRAVGALVDAGLADRDVGAGRFAYRIILTSKGRRVLKKAHAAIADAT